MSVLGTFSSGSVLTAAELNQFNNVTSLYNSSTTVPNATTTEFSYTSASQVHIDTSGWHSTTVNPTRITVDKDGIYLVGTYCQFNYSGAAADFSMAVRQNGTYTQNDANVQADYFPGPNAVSIMTATAGDYFESVAYQTSGGTRSVWAGRQGFYVILLRTT